MSSYAQSIFIYGSIYFIPSIPYIYLYIFISYFCLQENVATLLKDWKTISMHCSVLFDSLENENNKT